MIVLLRFLWNWNCRQLILCYTIIDLCLKLVGRSIAILLCLQYGMYLGLHHCLNVCLFFFCVLLCLFSCFYGPMWSDINKWMNEWMNKDVCDTKSEICTSLKSEFYFRFRWPPSTKSTLISYISVRFFVTICGKICPPQSRNLKNRILHTSKIINLLPVCLRNNRHPADNVSKPYAKFYRRW